MKISRLIVIVVAASIASVAAQAEQASKGVAVAYPWTFTKGNETPKGTAVDTVREIAQKAGYAVASDDAAKVWKGLKLPDSGGGYTPTKAQLKKFCKALNADVAMFGSVAWHTRSIWVGTGPKTISTATVSVYVYSVRANNVVYSKKGVTGRSDEKENTLKVVGDVLLTPFVTAVSGGPATPREQRAVQIALARAYHNRVTSSTGRK